MNRLEHEIISMIQHYWHVKNFITNEEVYTYLSELKRGLNPFFEHRIELFERAIQRDYELSHHLFAMEVQHGMLIKTHPVSDVCAYQRTLELIKT